MMRELIVTHMPPVWVIMSGTKIRYMTIIAPQALTYINPRGPKIRAKVIASALDLPLNSGFVGGNSATSGVAQPAQ